MLRRYTRAGESQDDIVLRCGDRGPLRDFFDDDFCQGGTYADSHPGDVAFE